MTSGALRDQTEKIQREVSDPAVSAWVHANAGSGKTYVLARRVIRLMLSGCDPSRILCLTFTKAAAANMSLRVFNILSSWTAYSDEQLRKELDGMGYAGRMELSEARRLFARAVETPGGLKIQTIHAFCERLLHLFPFEANVPARFEALDDQQQAQLLAQAREETLKLAVSGDDTLLGEAVRIVSTEATGDGFSALLREALAKRQAIAAVSTLQTGELARRLSARFSLAPGQDVAAIEQALVNQGPSQSEWEGAIVELKASSPADVKLGVACHNMLSAATPSDRLEFLRSLYFTKGGEVKKSSVTRNISDRVKALFEEERERAVDLFVRLKAAKAVERSIALHRLVESILATYASLKQVRGLLDFDDLIDAAARLLERSEASWVLYKLDQGIDHILVDEAQDTSPRQWTILKRLAGDFFSGETARGVTRTIFAVGDEKQSIFSFQGADPRAFGQSKQHFQKLVSAVQQTFVDGKLRVSFRSTQPVLQSVDKVFEIEANFAGLTLERLKPDPHEAFKDGLPGLVEVWKPVAAQKQAEPESWTMPLDALSEFSPTAILATRIAQRIKGFISPGASEAVLDGNGKPRPIRPGDIMILVRRRNAFFDAIIRALKREGVPVAGADRLKLMDHIVVKDLVAAGRAALLPQDDFTLACLLKSPLFGFDDDDLIRLAPHRKASLIAELRRSAESKDQEAAERIALWGAAARRLGPFGFYSQILSKERGRHAMLSRLGEEAGDAIDEFLRLALQSEREDVASLSVFLHNLQSADIEIKRDMEAAGEAVRVMTVHASKGLEAKIVFLPDTCAAPTHQHDARLVELEVDGDYRVPVWRKGKTVDPEAIGTEIDGLRAAGLEEYRRLLYVAMTRAEERLYICGYHGSKGLAQGCWYSMIEATLPSIAYTAPAPWDESETVTRIGTGAELAASAEQPAHSAALPANVQSWLHAPAAPEQAPAPPIRPSHVIAAADQDDSSPSGDLPLRKLALLEGNIVHALLQHLPQVPDTMRSAAAERYLAARARMLDPARRETLVANVFAVLAHPGCSELFGLLSRAEAAIAGRVALPGGREIEISGRVDRLAVLDREVLIADFKSGVPPRGEPQASYVAQLALYRAALQRLFPSKKVRAFLIWTIGPRIDELDPSAMDMALRRLPPGDTSA